MMEIYKNRNNEYIVIIKEPLYLSQTKRSTKQINLSKLYINPVYEIVLFANIVIIL